jgi:hypothetical protein
VGSSPASGSRLRLNASVHDERMSEQTDATEDRPDDDDVALAREDREELSEKDEDGAEQAQPWAKTSLGDTD